MKIFKRPLLTLFLIGALTACSDDNNDLTGINAYDFGTDMSPPGLYPISSQ